MVSFQSVSIDGEPPRLFSEYGDIKERTAPIRRISAGNAATPATDGTSEGPVVQQCPLLAAHFASDARMEYGASLLYILVIGRKVEREKQQW